MTDLSPAAQAVMNASFTYHHYQDIPLSIAAAIRAAADQVVPEQGCPIYGLTERENERQQVRSQLLAIAAEWEGDSKENERPDRLIAGDVWEFEWGVQVKGKRKPQLQKLKFKVIGYHPYQCAWQLMSLDGEHYCYLLEFAPQYEDMTYIGHLDQDELEGSL